MESGAGICALILHGSGRATVGGSFCVGQGGFWSSGRLCAIVRGLAARVPLSTARPRRGSGIVGGVGTAPL